MKKTFNWGHGITVFYLIFVSVVATALISSFSVDHSLVVEEYYNEDLAYQSRFNKIKNNLQSDNITIEVKDDHVLIAFPDDKEVKGTIHFYRASDKSKDFTKTIKKNHEIFTKDNIDSGKWSVKVDWTSDNESYYIEQVIFI